MRYCTFSVKACEENDVILAVCHVMRYFPPCVKIREIIDRGNIGDVMTINHTKNIGYWHFAHSFVRGNWRNEVHIPSFSQHKDFSHFLSTATFRNYFAPNKVPDVLKGQ